MFVERRQENQESSVRSLGATRANDTIKMPLLTEFRNVCPTLIRDWGSVFEFSIIPALRHSARG